MTNRSDLPGNGYGLQAEPLPARPFSRRRMMTLMGAAGGFALLGCKGDTTTIASTSTGAAASSTSGAGSSSSAASAPSATTTAATTANTAADSTSTSVADETTCAATPEETGGPFPADGSNQNGDGALADLLHDPRAVRADIRSDLDGTNTQDGVPMTLQLRVVDTAGSCRAVAGAAVYLWHCNRDGNYSTYNSPMNGGDFSDRSFLRGVQVTDANGVVTFTTILPGRYDGRAFHIHFEVYDGSDLSSATKVLTSQIALEDGYIDALYAQVGYTEAAGNITHNSSDNVFRDGVSRQLMTMTGDASGLFGSIVVGL